jgi:hypothetical protein
MVSLVLQRRAALHPSSRLLGFQVGSFFEEVFLFDSSLYVYLVSFPTFTVSYLSSGVVCV